MYICSSFSMEFCCINVIKKNLIYIKFHLCEDIFCEIIMKGLFIQRNLSIFIHGYYREPYTY